MDDDDYRAPVENHVARERAEIIKSLVEGEKKRKIKLKDELVKKTEYTKSLLCPEESTSRGGLTSLKEFTDFLDRQMEKSELRKAGLTPEEQELYFSFRKGESSQPESQSFRDKLKVIREKIEDFFRNSEQTELKRPIDDIVEIERNLFGPLEDIPDLRKRRKRMIKEEIKLDRIMETPVCSQDEALPGPRSSKSKWDQR